MNSYELSLNDAYFLAHPEKVAGVESIRSGQYGPEKEIKGTKADVLAMFAFLDKQEIRTENVQNDLSENDKIKATASACALALALELENDLEAGSIIRIKH